MRTQLNNFEPMRKLIFMFAAVIAGLVLQMTMSAGADAAPKKETIIADTSLRIIHIYVALCDNDSQGIVPVNKRMGNGNDPDNNLYWGNGYGVRTFFNASEEWRLLETVKNPKTHVLERCIWKHRRYNSYIVADAYKGARIKPCTIDFLNCASGNAEDTIFTKDNGKSIVIPNVKTKLACYVGHDGLMDFVLPDPPAQKNGANKDVMILACASKMYFKEAIATAGANPVLWTTNLMGPEAYTLKAAIDGWLLHETGDQIVERAAQAYNKYVNCGIGGARRLFTSGF